MVIISKLAVPLKVVILKPVILLKIILLKSADHLLKIGRPVKNPPLKICPVNYL